MAARHHHQFDTTKRIRLNVGNPVLMCPLFYYHRNFEVQLSDFADIFWIANVQTVFLMSPCIYCEPQFELRSSLASRMACTVSLALIDGEINLKVCNSVYAKQCFEEYVPCVQFLLPKVLVFFLRRVINAIEITVK